MPFASGSLVHAEAFERFPIGLFPHLIHTAADEPPGAILAHSALLAYLGDGQDFCHGDAERLERILRLDSEGEIGMVCACL